MKTTGIVRFDGSAVMLIKEANEICRHEFESLCKMNKYCLEKKVDIEIAHYHPGSGLNALENGNGKLPHM